MHRWLLWIACCALFPLTVVAQDEAVADVCFQAAEYVAYRTPGAVEVDGRLDDEAWAGASWSEPFVEMATAGTAPYATRVKLLWDDDALYVAAQLEEPHVWATLTERDSRIYLDHAFEVFFDPDGDTHAYYEFEINALGTVWDLLLLRAYRDGGPALSAWDIQGLRSAVTVDGTLNDPTDTDRGWGVELAFPWAVITETAPEGRRPTHGTQWRVNFSRSHWYLDTVDASYRKRPDTPARWSVWSPQGVNNIHKPECWGFVQFADVPAGDEVVKFANDPNEDIKWALRRLFYRQRAHWETHGRYADTLHALEADDVQVEGLAFLPRLETTQSAYEITSPGVDGSIVHLRDDGRIWVSGP